ncbi:hypothetical protein EDB83DRAFT_2198485, partial [Lactarius deliciosus]
PHQAFLASLIHTSELMQDEWDPDHTAPKWTRLQARKVGRCKRALGETLGWRRW